MQGIHQLRHPVEDADPSRLIGNGGFGYPPGTAIWHVSDLQSCLNWYSSRRLRLVNISPSGVHQWWILLECVLIKIYIMELFFLSLDQLFSFLLDVELAPAFEVPDTTVLQNAWHAEGFCQELGLRQ